MWFNRFWLARADGIATADRLVRQRAAATSDTPSMLFFTCHKCASVYSGKVLSRLSAAAGMRCADFEGLAYKRGKRTIQQHLSQELAASFDSGQLPSSAAARVELQRLLPPAGFFFGPLRNSPLFYQLPHLDQFRIVLMLRDPRDVLTSLYFSMAYSHHLPKKNDAVREQLLSHRAQARHQSIDAYVLDKAAVYQRFYENYRCHLLDRANVIFVTYEEMVGDFAAWLTRIVQFWGVACPPRQLKALIQKADFSVPQENPYSHKRQVQPGDHLRKLRPETIEKLNHQFDHILQDFGYPPKSKHPGDAAA